MNCRRLRFISVAPLHFHFADLGPMNGCHPGPCALHASPRARLAQRLSQRASLMRDWWTAVEIRLLRQSLAWRKDGATTVFRLCSSSKNPGVFGKFQRSPGTARKSKTWSLHHAAQLPFHVIASQSGRDEAISLHWHGERSTFCSAGPSPAVVEILQKGRGLCVRNQTAKPLWCRPFTTPFSRC